MSDIGKIFIYEKEPAHLNKYQATFNKNGFFTFGTNNLYKLIKYAKEITPDIIIINLPASIILSNEAILEIENNICTSKACPHVYINYNLPDNHIPKIHQWNFSSEDLTYEQILQIIKHSSSKNNLN